MVSQLLVLHRGLRICSGLYILVWIKISSQSLLRPSLFGGLRAAIAMKVTGLASSVCIRWFYDVCSHI